METLTLDPTLWWDRFLAVGRGLNLPVFISEGWTGGLAMDYIS